MKEKLLKKIILLDGDNTLWDTNEIFTKAQLKLLEGLENRNLDIDPEIEFKTLRNFDDVLIKKFKTPEYDFRVLALALYLFYNHWNKDDAIDEAIRVLKNDKKIRGKRIADKCYEAFKKEMKEHPPLFEGAKDALSILKKWNGALILLSEGNAGRIERIVNHHKIGKYFDLIFSGEKSLKKFNEAVKEGRKILRRKDPKTSKFDVIVIGDLLDKDILFGNRIGAITIHKPGGYKPHQKPTNKMEVPKYTAKDFSEIINILSN